MTDLGSIYLNDSVLFKVTTYDVDGATLITPLSCVCSVFNQSTGVAVVTSAAGVVGLGYAQYNWSGSATVGVFEAVLTVTLSSGVVKSETFIVTVLAKPALAFTYDLTTDVGKVRFEIGDTEQGQGVKPNGANLTDAEIQMLVTREGSWGAAAAAACEMLSRAWSKIAASRSVGQRSQANQQAENFRARAQELRSQYGGGISSLQAGVIALDFMQKDNEDEDA